MKRKLSSILVIFIILALVSCQKSNTKFGIEVKSYENLEYIYFTGPDNRKRKPESELKQKILDLIQKLDEDDFEEEKDPVILMGGRATIYFDEFVLGITDDYISVINPESNVHNRFNAKKEIPDLSELYKIIKTEFGMQ